MEVYTIFEIESHFAVYNYCPVSVAKFILGARFSLVLTTIKQRNVNVITTAPNLLHLSSHLHAPSSVDTAPLSFAMKYKPLLLGIFWMATSCVMAQDNILYPSDDDEEVNDEVSDTESFKSAHSVLDTTVSCMVVKFKYQDI